MADLFFGGMFPAPGGTTPVPAVAAELALSSVTGSGNLDQVIWRARAVGVGGNAIEVSMEAHSGPLEIDDASNEVIVRFQDGVTTLGALAAAITADSTSIEMIGTWNDNDLLSLGDDEFGNTNLTGGLGATTETNNGYWDGHFPFSVEDEPDVPPVTPDGVATFALRLEAGTRVTYSWATDLFKSYDGKEQRAALLDDPRERYDGAALLSAAQALAGRSDIAQHAALGGVFSLGLPYEEATIDAVAGAVVSLGTATSALDWAVPGQRVLLVQGAGEAIETTEAVIQSVTAFTVTLDAAPGLTRGVIMPIVPVLLDAQQAFARYRSGCERWSIAARASLFGFPAAATVGELEVSLGGETVTLRALTTGIEVSVELAVGGSGIVPVVVPGSDGNFHLYVVAEDGATIAELRTALASYLEFAGTFDENATITSGDAFTLTAFTGAGLGGPQTWGAGATVTQLLGRPLWDRGLENSGTITDSIHTMTDAVQFMGLPTCVVEAEIPDWGRHIRYTSTDWQWMKAFLAAVKGRARSFWLPTMRADLVSVADVIMHGPDDYTITIDAAIGNYPLWTARGYSVLRIEQGSAVHYVQVEADGSDGETFTLDVEGAELAESPIDRISWVELVHLESDNVEVTWTEGKRFSVALTARVVQQ